MSVLMSILMRILMCMHNGVHVVKNVQCCNLLLEISFIKPFHILLQNVSHLDINILVINN